MCAIIDANVKHEILGSPPKNATDAGAMFLHWLTAGNGQMVVGGSKLRTELLGSSTSEMSRLFEELKRAGAIKEVKDGEVDARANELCDQQDCQSDDQHIIALAQVSGARLLYSNDRDLHRDFLSRRLIDSPRGKVYPTQQAKNAANARKRLLNNRELCRSSRR